jgi:hypothetical protein
VCVIWQQLSRRTSFIRFHRTYASFFAATTSAKKPHQKNSPNYPDLDIAYDGDGNPQWLTLSLKYRPSLGRSFAAVYRGRDSAADLVQYAAFAYTYTGPVIVSLGADADPFLNNTRDWTQVRAFACVRGGFLRASVRSTRVVSKYGRALLSSCLRHRRPRLRTHTLQNKQNSFRTCGYASRHALDSGWLAQPFAAGRGDAPARE